MTDRSKKVFSILLASAMMLTCGVSSFATEKDEPEFLEDDTISMVKENLDPSQYAGLYMENGDLHILATDKENLSRTIAPLMARNTDLEIVIDENEMNYSYAQLRDAQEIVVQNMENLDVFETYVDAKQNKLVMSSPDWTQDEMDAAVSTTGISSENIEFVTVSQNTIDNEFIPIPEDSSEVATIESKASKMRPGDALYYTTNGSRYRASLTVPIVWNRYSTNKMYGYMTCGHSYDKTGTAIYDSNNTLLGAGSVWDYGGEYDLTLIDREGRTNIATLSLPDDSAITHTGAPVQGDSITRYGSTSGYVSGEIIATDVNVRHSTTGVVITGFKTDAQVAGGDSGGPVVAHRSSRNVLVGINSTTSYSAAFDAARSKYDIGILAS